MFEYVCDFLFIDELEQNHGEDEVSEKSKEKNAGHDIYVHFAGDSVAVLSSPSEHLFLPQVAVVVERTKHHEQGGDGGDDVSREIVVASAVNVGDRTEHVCIGPHYSPIKYPTNYTAFWYPYSLNF